MASLRELQRGFARAILHGEGAGIDRHVVADGIAPAARVGIYRNTSRAVLTDALRLTYPAVERLVGTAFFAAQAARFIRRQPPRSACLDDYGEGFAEFLSGIKAASSVPYLPAVVRFEWALGVAAHAPEVAPLDVAALSAVAPARHGGLRFWPHPSVCLLRLEVPADQIADAVLSGDAAAMAAVDLAAGPVDLLVHRGAEGVRSRWIDVATQRFLQRLYDGETLGALLDGAGNGAGDVRPDGDVAAADLLPAARLLAEQIALGCLGGFSVPASNMEAGSIQ